MLNSFEQFLPLLDVFPLKEMLTLFWVVVPFVSFLMVPHRLSVVWLKLHLSRKLLHLSLMLLLTKVEIWSSSTLMFGSDGFAFLSASRSSAILAASVGKFGLISFIQPAGMFLFAAFMTFCLKVRSPLCTFVGSGVS